MAPALDLKKLQEEFKAVKTKNVKVSKEHGASASNMVAGKLLDAIARIPGYTGENADTQKAYTQASLADFEGDTQTWIEIPEDQWPTSWYAKDGVTPLYRRPVARL